MFQVQGCCYGELPERVVVACAFRLSNLFLLRETGFTQGHQPVLASSSLRSGEVRDIFRTKYSTNVRNYKYPIGLIKLPILCVRYDMGVGIGGLLDWGRLESGSALS